MVDQSGRQSSHSVRLSAIGFDQINGPLSRGLKNQEKHAASLRGAKKGFSISFFSMVFQATPFLPLAGE